MTAAPGRIFTQCPSKHRAALGIRPEHRHMDWQPRHAAAQVTLLKTSFVFLPFWRQVPLMWVENSSSEQHSFGKLPMLLPLGARKESSSEHSRASSSEHSRASSSGAACSSSGMQLQQRQQRAARAERQDQGAEQVPSASRSSSSGELQAAAAASGERRAAAATESSLVQARKSGLTKANIDPQSPSAANGCAPGQSTAAGNYHCKMLVTQMRR